MNWSIGEPFLSILSNFTSTWLLHRSSRQPDQVSQEGHDNNTSFLLQNHLPNQANTSRLSPFINIKKIRPFFKNNHMLSRAGRQHPGMYVKESTKGKGLKRREKNVFIQSPIIKYAI